MRTAPFRKPVVPYGNIIPSVESSDSQRPWADFAPASWLPVSDTTTNKAMGFFTRLEQPHQDYIVITPGKIVALTRENLGLSFNDGPVGRIVPAGVRKAWAAASGGDDVLEYTSLDVEQGIQDLTTGAPVTAAVAYTKTQLQVALRKRGLLATSEGLEKFISKPIGVTSGAVFAWCGGDGVQPSGLRFHNYKRQARIALTLDYVLAVPHVPASTLVTRDVEAISDTVASIAELDTPATPGDLAWITGAGGHLATLGLTTRYGTPTHSDYVGAVLGARRIEVAPHLPLKLTSSGNDITANVFKRKVKSINDLTKAGDYFVDEDMGIVFMYEAGGNALPTGMSAGNVLSFSCHSTHNDQVTDLVYIKGNIAPGDLVTYDKFSNFVPFVARPTETEVEITVGEDDFSVTEYVDPSTYHLAEDILGQVLTFSRYPQEDMVRVKTWYESLGTGIVDKMPGSATGGYTDNQTWAGGGQFMVLINLLK